LQNESENKEEIENYLEDGLSLIDCAEKYFYYLFVTLYYKNFNTDKLKNVTEKIRQMNKNYLTILDNFDKLREFLKLEGQLNNDIDQLIYKARTVYRNGEYMSSYKLIEKAFRIYRTFNYQEFKRLIKHVEDAGDLIKGKDIILLLGETGAGKSTVIQFLLGMKMLKKEINGIPHIEGEIDEYLKRMDANGILDEKITNQIKNLKSSCFFKSETRYLNPIELELDNTFIIDSIKLCDTPGFRDSNGPEIDVANAISIIKAINTAKSVRPVVLISEKGFGDRGLELKRLAMTIASIIPDFNNFHDKINFIFTKFGKEDGKNILSKINNLILNVPNRENLNESLIDFLNLLKIKLEVINNNQTNFILDPINDNPKNLLKLLIENHGIENPEKYFKYFITDSSLSYLNEQISINDNIINNCLFKHEYRIVKYKLEEIKYLHEITDNQILKNKYNTIVTKVINHINKVFDNIKSDLSQLFKLEDDISEENLNKIQENYLITNKLDVFKGKIEDKMISDKLSIINYIDEQLKIFETFVEKNHFNDYRVIAKIKKIKRLSEDFDDFHPMLRTAKNFISKQFNEFEDSFNLIFVEGEKATFDYEKFLKKIESLYEFIEIYKEAIDNDKYCLIEKNVKKFIQIYQQKFQICLETLNNIFTENMIKNSLKTEIREETPNIQKTLDISNKEIKAIQQINEFFQDIQNILNFQFNIHIENIDDKKQILKNLENEMKYFILNQFNEIYEKLKQKFNSKQTEIIVEQDEYKFRFIRILSEIQITSNQLKNKFYDLVNLLPSFLNRISNETIITIDPFIDNLHSNIRKLKEIINNGHRLKWIEVFDKYAYELYKANIEENILFNFEKDIQIIESSTLSLNNFSDLSEKAESYIKLNQIYELFSENSNISNKIKTPIDSFNISLKNILSDLKMVLTEIEELKESPTEDDEIVYFDNPRLHNLKKIAIFFETLRKIKYIIKKKINFEIIEDNRQIFESILHSFNKYYQDKINKIFTDMKYLIKRESNHVDKSNDFLSFEILKNKLKKIIDYYKKLKNNFQNVYQIFDTDNEINEILFNLFPDLYYCLESEIEKAENTDDIQKLNNLKDFLKSLEMINFKCLIDYNFEISFTTLKEKTNKILNDSLQTNIKNFEESLIKYKYNELVEIFSKYKSNESYKIIFTNFQKKLINFFEEKSNNLRSLAEEFIDEDYKIESAKFLVNSIQDIDKLLKIDENFLLDRDHKIKEIEEFKLFIRKIFLNKIDSLAENINFLNAKNCF